MNEDDLDDGPYYQINKEAGVLFGAAYENKYIDILENEDITDFMEINEKMLEISLGMNTEELMKLTKIEIKVDTTNTHMQYVGEVLKSLTLLKLNDSVIPSIRDLGTSFKNIKILYLNRWEMKTLAGLSWFEFLKELYISYNDIDDLFDISYWNNLEVLDLEGNNVPTWDNISYLLNWSKLTDLNLSNNPISNYQNYQNRVKELLPQLRFLDDLHIDAINKDEVVLPQFKFVKDTLTVIEEKFFILSKFSKFSFKIDELENLADEALDWIGEEDNEEMIIKLQVKRHERKNEAFEKETFEMFDEEQDSLFDNDSYLDNSKLIDTKQRMFRSCTNGFMDRKGSDLVDDKLNFSRMSAYDDSESILRTSMKGIFTGRKKNEHYITKNSTLNTCEESDDLDFNPFNDRADQRINSKELKDEKKNMFSYAGFSENIEAKGIEDLIVEFSANTNNFKQSMQSIDVSSKLIESSKLARGETQISYNYDSPERETNNNEKYRMFNRYQDSGKKVIPIKAERIIIIKRPISKIENN